jgi:hypothetical protein
MDGGSGNSRPVGQTDTWGLLGRELPLPPSIHALFILPSFVYPWGAFLTNSVARISYGDQKLRGIVDRCRCYNRHLHRILLGRIEGWAEA